MKIKLSREKSTGNFWIDTGLVVLMSHFGEGEHDADYVRRWLLGRLIQKTGNIGKYFDKTTGTLQEYEKVNWVYPTNLFIKVSGVGGEKIEVDGEKYPTQPPVFDLKIDLGKRPGICDICGDTTLLTDAKMWMFPFLVDPQKFSTFYPGTKRGLRLCARCALAGLAVYLGWLWKAQGGDALHFFIFYTERAELERLHREVLEPIKVKSDKSGNAPTAFWGPYIHETTLGLLMALFVHVHQSDQLSEEGRKYLAALLGAVQDTLPTPIALYAVTGTPRQAFNMQTLREFTNLHSLYRLYELWTKTLAAIQIDPNSYRRLILILSQFQDQSRESIWRDRIAREILEFGDPFPFIEEFLFDVRAREENPGPLILGTLTIFGQYLKEVLGMNEQFQRVLAGFGYNLGYAAQEHSEMGLLYALRNAKNPEDFYRVLNDAQFRLNVTIPEGLLLIEKGERIAGVPWIRVKTILSIYAMNAFLRRTARQEETLPLTEG